MVHIVYQLTDSFILLLIKFQQINHKWTRDSLIPRMSTDLDHSGNIESVKLRHATEIGNIFRQMI